jgi:ubiquinone/menaquinone biosynthesis C-methylase UbiE
MSVSLGTSGVPDYDAPYYLRREASPTLLAEVKAVTDLLDPEPSDQVLEVGCGGGTLLSHLIARGPRNVVGVDWLRTSVDLARRRNSRARLLQGDACALPFRDGRFDKVVAQHLVEHFEDTKRVLTEWRRVLRPKGVLVIVTPNIHFPHQEWFDDPTHRHIFSEADLRDQLSGTGFSVNETRVINPYVGSLSFQFAAARYLQFLRRLPWFGHRGMSLVASASRL